MTLRNALSRWLSGRLPKIAAAESHVLQSEAAQAIATGKLDREQGESFLDAVFAEHGTCQSHEPSRTHARRAQEEPSWESL